MNYIQRFFGHLSTINSHKLRVMKNCFRVGLYYQGIMHDLSKYSPVEFFGGVKYFQGSRSPNAAQKEILGYSPSWLHHKGRNKHHFEYWIDYTPQHELSGMPIPTRYVVEMFCDMVAASKTYRKEAYTDSYPLEYLQKIRPHMIIHPDADALLYKLMKMLADNGEDAVFSYIRKEIRIR